MGADGRAVIKSVAHDRNRLPLADDALTERPLLSALFGGRRQWASDTGWCSGFVGSMGRTGTCADNAAMGSLFALVQSNVFNRQQWQAREELRLAIVLWIERTYDRRRRRRALGKLTPTGFESVHEVAHAA